MTPSTKPPVRPPALPPRPAPGAVAAAVAAAKPLVGHEQESELRKRAVNLFTFLRELVSLRTTVVRNCASYDRMLWISEVPTEDECECIAFKAPKEDEADDWWLKVKKPIFVDPPEVPEELAKLVDAEKLADSSAEPASPFPGSVEGAAGPANPSAPGVSGAKPANVGDAQSELKAAWWKYLSEKWRPWASEDRRKRGVLRIYTDLFSLYQQQKELGESYEVVVGLGQLRWAPKPGVEVNRHLVAVQTSIEFDSQKGVIMVGPAAEGAKPRLEEDMLELDERPGPEVLTTLELQVAACDDDNNVWRAEPIVGAIKSFVHSLGDGRGTYTDDINPVERATAVPQMRWAPAIIVRHRTEQGLLQVYGKILEDLKKRPEIPPGLVPLVEIGAHGRERNAPPQPAAEVKTEELLFPLHFNDEQKEIVHRLYNQSGVVVQGPPGTGKSHTIANLVCHLLATGNRVLVTSHAPRALRILKDKIPQAITNMCVVLLGNDRTALDELEKSVQVITEQLNTWDPRTREATIKEMENQLQALRGRAAEVDKNLRAVRESDTFKHPALPGGYSGTLQNIAQQLFSRQEQFGWIDQYARTMELEALPENPGLTNQECSDLLVGLRAVDAQGRKEMERELPGHTDAKEPAELEQMFTEERQWAQTAETARVAVEQPDLAVPPVLPLPKNMDADHEILVELAETMDRILRQHSELEGHRFNWGPRLSRDVRALQYDHWRLLHEQTTPKLEAIKQQPEQVYELEVIHIGEIEVSQFRDDVQVLHDHVAAGGKIKNLFGLISPAKERAYIFKNVQIGGKRVKAENLKQLLAWAEVQFQLKALEQLWSDVAEAPLGAVMRRLPVWYERLHLIELAQQMHKSIERARELFGRLPIVKMPHWDDTDELKMLSKQLKALVAVKEHSTRKHALDVMTEQAKRRSHSSAVHPVFVKLADALKRRDLDAYRAVYGEITELRSAREKWSKSGGLLKKLAERLPKAAHAISDDPANRDWEDRLEKFNEAWQWLRADRWLKQQLDPRHFDYLQSERKALQDHLQAAMVKLAAEKAWHHCMTRMTPAEETYLKAWMQAIRNIGAGSGKRATRYRKVARQALDKCRSAIPAWIMPIHRLAETVDPGGDLFDVVIVDEASQSGAEALFLQYIAKKIIIVGDDKQIAPYNVGINRDDVELLRNRHIADLPLSDYFDLEHSFFDQAYLRFANRIRLCEHFRCMPEIIQFSNALCYNNEPLIPLRQYGDGRIEPVVVARHVTAGKMEGNSPTVSNKAEAEAIVKQIAKMIEDPVYKDKTFGVISLLGEKQARIIEQKLLATIGPEEMERRRLICGDAYSFQGDERNVMFLSLVVSAEEGRRLATLTTPADERRFNVAASRARDQMWLFHSCVPDDLSPKCLRRQILEYCLNPKVPQEIGDDLIVSELQSLANAADRARVPAPPPFESWLEVDVYLQVRKRGYRAVPQRAFAGYRMDLVINGEHGRLAVECDGEEWQGQDRYDGDMGRQRQLERCGWRFWRIRGGSYYRNPDAAMQPLWDLLEKQGIRSGAGATRKALPVSLEETPEETKPASTASAAKKPRKSASNGSGKNGGSKRGS